MSAECISEESEKFLVIIRWNNCTNDLVFGYGSNSAFVG
jgi:hypothetical protein